jgi:type II secretory pathway pseudopilin PulG
MENKKVVVIVLVLVISVALIIGIVKNKNKTITKVNQTDAVVKTEETKQDSAANENKEEIKKEKVTYTGKVVGITPTSFIVDRAEGAVELKFTMETPVSKGKDKATLVDISAGTNIIAVADGEMNLESIEIE